ncbi:hypothetical protein OHA77_30995 [Streptosporangium sp. NBC_01639]|nr:hypothetical protein OHA77_30995 [Streptosporangium sp. NBC_01639]
MGKRKPYPSDLSEARRHQRDGNDEAVTGPGFELGSLPAAVKVSEDDRW